MNSSCFESNFGKIYLLEEENYLIGVDFLPYNAKNIETPLLREAKYQLISYFNGKLKKFSIPYKIIASDFTKKVLDELIKIPYGKTASYSTIAANIGNKNAQRAVGSACNKNPLLIIIPCHRVIAKNGSLTGFRAGIEIKKQLLKLESGIN